MEKHIYTWDEYQDDINAIKNHLLNKPRNIHIVSIYRGSLGMGAHLSNALDVPLSIVKFQSYDGDDSEVEFIHNAGITSSDLIVVVDDLGDSYETLKKVYSFFLEEYPETPIESFTMFGKKSLNDSVPRNMYLREHPEKWIAFPWEY